jgi:chemosensory pili system protein ChpE
MILLALAMAVAYCAPPGAVTAEAFRQATRTGWRGALAVELGSVIGDAVYGALAVSGLRALLPVAWARDVLGAVGVGLLLLLAWRGVAQARVPEREPGGGAARGTLRSAFAVGAALALANPAAIPFWLSFGSAAVVLHGRSAGPAGLWTFFAAFVAGCLAWSVLVALALARVGARLSPRLTRVASLVASALLAGFGLAMGASLLGV